ncbi:translocation/assembly module TamB domain-containing protein [Rhodovibrio salinarum]|uniref:Translocation/assembly module TamB n=1 Tax=Rhodovibrio salinarum TaxID=1087 RepID=A0A934QKW8_9PROT|nr:translocation/assembly module TamB domain-containing protein [Rhodovibrio salinarum]MBK1698627.1 translocation/assembly module TamB [Rhodovibrio salinarum]
MRLRRPLKIAGWTLVSLLAVLLVAVLALWGAANTERGQAWITATLESALSAPGAPATVSGLQGPLPQNARLGRLVLRDENGAWLTLEDARLSWSPLALLSGRLELQAVTAKRIALDHLPAGGPPEEPQPEASQSDPFEVPSLPVAVRLDRLSVDRLEIGEAVAGTAAAFRVDGQAAAPQGGRLTTNLSVDRLGGPSETLRLDAGYARDTRALALELRLDAPPGGLIAQLADLPDGAGATLALTGDGPINAWRGQLDARVGDAARLQTEIQFDTFNRLALQGEAEAPGYLTGDLARLAGGPVRFDLALARKGDSGLTIERGQVQSSTLTADLAGGLAADGTSLDAAIDLQVTDAAPLNALAAPAEVSGLTARVTAQGPVATPKLHVSAQAESAGVPDAGARDVTVDLRYTPAESLMQGQAEVEVTGAQGRFALDALSHYDGHPVHARMRGLLDLDGMTLHQASVTAALRDLQLSADGSADLATTSGDAAFNLQLATLDQLGPIVPIGLQGAGTLSGHAVFGGDGPLVDGTVTGDLQQFAAGIPILNALLQDRVQLATDLRLAEDGALTLSNLSVDSPNARIQGQLALPGDFASLQGDFTAEVPDAGVLQPALNVPLAGAATLSAHLDGALSDPGVRADLRLSEAVVASQRLGTATVKADVQTLASGPQGRVQLDTTDGPAGAVDAETAFALAGDSLNLSAIRAQVPGLNVQGQQLQVPLAGGALDGQFAVRSDQLRPLLSRVAGLEAAAAADLTVTLGPDGSGGQQVALGGDLRDVALPDDGPSVERVQLDGTVANAFASPNANITVDLLRAAAGPVEMDRLTVTARGTQRDLDVTAEGEGRGQNTLDKPIAISLAGNLAEDGPARVISLGQLRLEVGERTLALARTARLRLQGQEIALQDLALNIGDGRIMLDARRGTDQVELTLDADQVPLSYTALVLAEPQLSGRLNAQAQLSGPPSGPTGAVNLTLEDVGSEGTDLPPLNARVDLRLDEARQLIANGRVTGLGDSPLQLTANLPVDLNLASGFAAGLRQNDEISGRIAWAGEIAPLMPLVPATGHRLTGHADLDFRVAGTLDKPDLSGEAKLEDGRYENLDTGTLLTEMQALIQADDQRVEIARFTAKDGGTGTLDITGGVDMPQPGTPSQVDIKIDAKSAKLARLDFLVADADVDMEVSGSLQDMLVAGTVTVNQAEARIPNNLPPEVADLKVVSEQELRERRAAEQKAAESGQPASDPQKASRTELDIAIDIPGQTFVRGNGLDSEWRGNLVVKGTATAPIVRGQLEAVRGRVSLLNKTFNLENGQVAFSGGREINPRLDIRAVNESEELTAIVRVSGNASNPTFELSSVPELPQEQVLSRLLFGKSPGELGPAESAQLAAAVAELSLGGGGPGVIDRLRNFVGVDVLQLGGDADTGPTVEAGKYVTEDVFVGVEQGANATSSQVKVEVDVTEHIKMESAAGVTGSSSVGVQFHWDY